MKQIAKDEDTYCEQCGAPLHKTCANHCLICGKTLCDSCYSEKNFRCDECFKPENMFSTIRRSHIEQYAGCPYSLYLQLMLGIEPPMGKHAQLGVIVHELIDKMSKCQLTVETAKAELENKVVEWNLSTDDDYSIVTVELEDIGKTCLENYALIKDNFSSNFKSEHNIKFTIEDDLPTISCTLDQIDFIEDEIHIHDWKTGKPMSGQKLITDLQPPLYIYGVMKEFGKMPKSFNLHYLNPNKHISYRQIEGMKYEVKTSRATYILDVEEALERTRQILKDIKANKFNMPDDSTHQWRCNNMCWFGTSGKCKGSQDEQWRALNEQYKTA